MQTKRRFRVRCAARCMCFSKSVAVIQFNCPLRNAQDKQCCSSQRGSAACGKRLHHQWQESRCCFQKLHTAEKRPTLSQMSEARQRFAVSFS